MAKPAVNNVTRTSIEYRPNLEYEYKQRVTPNIVSPFDTGYLFIHNGALASDVEKHIQNMKNTLDGMIEDAKKKAGPLYDKYKAALALPYSHDKFEIIEQIEKDMADINGNLALEALPILEDLRNDWGNIEDLFNGTVIKLLNDEFPEGTTLEKEIKLDQLMRQLQTDRFNSDCILVDLYTKDPKSQAIQLQKAKAAQIARLLEDSSNLSYGKTDMSSIVDNRYYDTMNLLGQMQSVIPNTPQDTLDKQLVDVLQYILVNVNPYETNSVITSLKHIQSLLRLTIDDKITGQFSTRDKMRIASDKQFKEYMSGTLKDTFLYRLQISTKTLHIFEDIPQETSNAFDRVMDSIINGAEISENNYSNQMVGYDKVTNTDVKYKTSTWDAISDKEISRVLYNILTKMIDYLSKNSLPSQSNLRSWLITFCQNAQLNTSYDPAEKQEITLF